MKPVIKSVRLVLAALTAAAVWSTSAGAEKARDAVVEIHNGINLIGLAPPEGEPFDVPIMAVDESLGRLKGALDLIMRSSPLNAERVETLKQHGEVSIVYDPQYPFRKRHMSTLEVAVFLPKFSAPATDGGRARRDSLVLVGRHGIKWPRAELAAVLVHELAGHGMQHLSGRSEVMRNMDMECEAWLLQELAHQDFGLNKLAQPMVRFQKELAQVCRNFVRHLETDEPTGNTLWNRLSPDVPALLTMFEVYLEGLRQKGIILEAKQYLKWREEQKQRKIYRKGSGAEMTRVGILYLHGVGGPPNLAAAAKWFQKAARKGDPQAQFHIGKLFAEGRGVPRDLEKVYFWLSVTGERANKATGDRAQSMRNAIASQLSPVQISAVEARARAWRPHRDEISR